jgi:hypothetical protein
LRGRVDEKIKMREKRKKKKDERICVKLEKKKGK